MTIRLFPAALRGLATDLAMAWREYRYARHNRRHPAVPPPRLIHGSSGVPGVGTKPGRYEP